MRADTAGHNSNTHYAAASADTKSRHPIAEWRLFIAITLASRQNCVDNMTTPQSRFARQLP